MHILEYGTSKVPNADCPEDIGAEFCAVARFRSAEVSKLEMAVLRFQFPNRVPLNHEGHQH